MRVYRSLVTWMVLVVLAHAGDAWVATNGMGVGRAWHSATLLTSGEVLVVGGVTRSSAELYTPATHNWTATASLLLTRQYHSATLLADGRVLVAGGGTNTCEIYDPATQSWVATGSMSWSRAKHAAILLADGRVLVVGGCASTQAEVYDPASGQWTPTSGPMVSVRTAGVAATALPGGKVLLCGGWNGSAIINASEVYDPSTGTFQATGNMLAARYLHTSTLLPSGSVLVVGGYGAGMVGTCELFDPSSGTWSGAANLAVARYDHTASLLPSGKLLVAAGEGGPAGYQASCELYDWTTNSWSPAPALTEARKGNHTATLLPDGSVLIAGGYTGSGFTSTCDILSLHQGSWSAIATMPTGFTGRATQLLPSGKILFCTGVGDVAVRQTPFLLDPESGTWTPAGTLNIMQYQATVLLGNNQVLAVGSLAFGPGRACDMYDPVSNSWHRVADTNLDRHVSGLVLLSSGRVLAIGGTGALDTSCEIYDPWLDAWTMTGAPVLPRSQPGIILLPDGRVLAAGGNVANGTTDRTAVCELYDPRSGTWSSTGSMINARVGMRLALLPSGLVLAAGGAAQKASSEVFDPTTGRWQLTGPRNNADYSAHAQVLASGEAVTTDWSSERFDAITGTWKPFAALTAPRDQPNAWLLPNGDLCLLGGYMSSLPVMVCERYREPVDELRRPVISSVVAGATSLSCIGSGFSQVGSPPTGTAWSSAGGDNSGGSRSNIPCVRWTQLGSGRTWPLQLIGGFTGSTLTAAIPADAFGPGWLRVHVNGLASTGAYLCLAPPSVTLAASTAIISENGGSSVVTATASRPFAWPITVSLAVEGGTASAGDYSLTATALTIPAGSLTATAVVAGIPDAIIEPGGETVTVGISAVVNGVESGSQQATITITDYQTPGFAVSAISRRTTEAGQTATFTVRPSSPPLASITLNLASTDSTEGVVSSGSSLVFTTGDWTTAQTVTVTGIDDAIDDGDIAYSIIGSASSGDPDYQNRAMPAVAVVNDDDDSAGIAIAAPAGSITEGGGSATVGISLTSQPTANVSLGIASSATAQGTVGTASLLFTPANWNIPQQVTLTGADGDGVDNPEAGTAFDLVATVTSGPAEYPTSLTTNRTLTCYPSNAAPAIAAIAPQTVAEDSVGTAVPLAGITAGGNETQVLTITAVSSDPAILPDPEVTYTSPAASGSLVLSPVAQATGTVTVTVRVSDDASIGRAGAKDAARSTETAFTVTVTPLNDAPLLSGATATPWTQAEDDAASAGTLVGAILGGLTITDADVGAQRGLAITAAETTHGTWWYDPGSGWTALGTVSAGTARLLADDGSTRVRFVPAGDYTGTAALTIRAWDRTVGLNGGTGDASATGGATAFSAASATATVTITPVNDPPVLASATGRALNPVTGGQPNPGTPVASLIAGLVSDVDGDPQGIAITAIAGAGGTWEGSTDSGATWIDIAGAIAGGQALLLSDAGSMLVRYRPQANEAGTASLTYHAWDRSDSRTAGLAYAVAGTAYSAIQATSTVAVSSGNAAPVLTMPTSLLAYVENQAATPLDAAATVTDGDSGDFLGGALTATLIVGASADDELSIAPLGTVTVSGGTVRVGGTAVGTVAGGGGGAPLTVAWNAAATPAAAQAVLGALSYRNLSDAPSTAVRIVRVQTTDGDGGTSFPVTVTVTVAAVNDQPVIGGTAAVGPYIEDAAPLPLAAAATVADPDSPAFASGTLSVSLAAGGEASDVLAVAPGGRLGLAGGEVSWDGTVFGTVSGGSGPATPLVVLLDADASQAAVQGLLHGLAFEARSQHPSAAARTVRLRLADGAGAVSADVDIAVAVQPVNDAPGAAPVDWQVNPASLNYLPAGQLGFADADAPAATTLVATITALPAAGTITVRGAAVAVGGTFTWQDVLDQEVRYQAPAAEGTRTLSFTLGDGVVAGIGPYDLAIQVTGTISNLPPELGLGGVAAWQEALPPVAVDPNATVRDPDSPDFAGGELSAVVTLNGTADDRLALMAVGGVGLSGSDVQVSGVTVGTLISSGAGATPLVVSLNASADEASVERLVRAVGFSVVGTKPTAEQRTVAVTVRDGDSPAATTCTAQVAVTPVNSPPELRFPRVATAISEGAAAQRLDDAATCVDQDSDDLAGGQLTIGFTGFHEAEDLLALSDTAAITIAGAKVNHTTGGELGTWSGGGADPLVVALTANTTPDRVQDLLRAVTVRNTAENPTAGTRVVRATLSDGDGGSGSADIGVYVAPVNDPPGVTIGAGAVVWIQGAPPTAIDPLAEVADVDSADFDGGRLTASIAAGADASDRLSLVPTGPIAVVGAAVTWSGTEIGTVSGGTGSTPLIVTLDADATPERMRDLLRCLAFDSTAALPDTQNRTVAIVVEDGDGGASTQRMRTVQVVRVNLPPVLALSVGAAAFTEDAAAVVVDAGATALDTDSADLDGGRLTIAVAGMVASDRLDVPDQGTPGFGIGRSGATVTWGGYPIGTVAGGVGEPLIVDLLPAATDVRVQDLLRVVTYATTAQNPPATRTITAVLSDGDGGTSAPVQRTVAITAVNDPPSASPLVLTVAGQTATGRWEAIDPEGDAVTWTVVTQPGNGALGVDLTGAWSFTPSGTAPGSALVRVTDSHGAVTDLAVTVLVTVPADPRPAVASDPPPSVQVGQDWVWDLLVAPDDIAASPDLEYEAIGAPAGLTAVPAGLRRATIAWAVPAGATAGSNVRFLLRISDRASGRSALVPVLIHLRAAIGGGG